MPTSAAASSMATTTLAGTNGETVRIVGIADQYIMCHDYHSQSLMLCRMFHFYSRFRFAEYFEEVHQCS